MFKVLNLRLECCKSHELNWSNNGNKMVSNNCYISWPSNDDNNFRNNDDLITFLQSRIIKNADSTSRKTFVFNKIF